MRFLATREFREACERLDDASLQSVNEALRHLGADPGSAWARQNRVAGEQGSAWLIVVRTRREDLRLYWGQPHPDDPLRLLLLLAR